MTKGKSQVKHPTKPNKNQTEVIFSQANTTKKSEHSKPDITCFHCAQNGRYTKKCPKKADYMNATVDDIEFEVRSESEYG